MATKIPSFSYTGTYSTEIKNGYWYIYLKSSGTIKFSYAKRAAEVSACGGGGGGGGVINEGDYGRPGGAGGSGIVILRGTEDDMLPIIFNGTQISQLIYNGTTIQHLIYNGQQLY